jgi:hypothetical protein
MTSDTGSYNLGSTVMGRPIALAISSSVVLFLVYIGVLSLLETFDHAIMQFVEFWYWMIPLVVGFGVQVGLYSDIRNAFRARARTPNGVMATSGGVSTTSMIVCCLHHVTDVLPVIGLSAAAVFLTVYQPVFLALGVFSNLVGITIMLTVMQQNNLVNTKGKLSNLLRYDMKRVRNTVVVSSIILMIGITGSLVLSSSLSTEDSDVLQASGLDPIEKEENGISFTITPMTYSSGQSIVFEIMIDTHQGSLDFDLEDVSVLETSDGNRYDALSWEGSPPGGHHRSGKLIFPSVDEDEFLRLTIKDVGGVSDRVFTWNLQSSGEYEAASSPSLYDDFFLGGSILAVLMVTIVMNYRSHTERSLGKYDRLMKDKYKMLREKNE